MNNFALAQFSSQYVEHELKDANETGIKIMTVQAKPFTYL